MPERDQNVNRESSRADWPAAPWLEDALAAGRSVLHGEVLSDLDALSSESFLQKCAGAGQVALDVAKLRSARGRLGFLPISVDGYLRRLCERADVAMAPILGWCGIEATSPQDVGFARGWGRLAREIGLSLREALVQSRLSFAEAAGLEIVPAPVRQRQTGRSRRTRLEEYEALIDQMASQCDDETLARLRTAEAEISNAFRTG